MKTLIPALLLVLHAGSVSAEILASPPEQPDPQDRYVFYLHGRIVEGSDGRPTSADYGPYEYRDILSAFSGAGFVVISEVRPKDTDVLAYARKVETWILGLIGDGVPAQRISVVGASKGGIITTHVSSLLGRREISYVILAGLFGGRDPVELSGRVLSIHDASDNYPIAPEAHFRTSPGLAESEIVVTHTGLGHGLLYKPHKEWFDDTVAWIKHERLKAAPPDGGSPK